MMQRLFHLVALLAALSAAWPAGATDPHDTPLGIRYGRDAALWQARSCKGETNGDLETCTAMIWVHVKRAKTLGYRSLVSMIRCYSSPVRSDECRRARDRRLARIRGEVAPATGVVDAATARGRPRPDGEAVGQRRWVRMLHPTARSAPAGWPSTVHWGRTQTNFRPLLEHVESVFAGDHPDPCPNAFHYMGRQRLDGDPKPGWVVDPECLPDSESEQRFLCRGIEDECTAAQPGAA